MRILGIDPGLTTAGLGLIDTGKKQGPKALEWLTIETEKTLPLALRLFELSGDLKEYLKSAKPDLAVVERLFFTVNKQTAMETSQARGVILAVLAGEGIDVLEVTPSQLKTAIAGDGNADKKQMQSMVKRTLKLEEIPSPPDAADALAMALYGAFTYRDIVRPGGPR